MKKLSVLIALILAFAGTGYAQTSASAKSYQQLVPPPIGIFTNKVVGLTLPVGVNLGSGTVNYNLVATTPCRLVDTIGLPFRPENAATNPLMYNGGPFANGETRTYPLSGFCLDVPESAVGIVLRIASLGLTDNSLGCGGNVSTTTLSTPSASGGGPNGCVPSQFVVFWPGQFNSVTGLALVTPVYGLGGYSYNSIGIKVTGGTTHVVADVLGYITQP